jgi:type IV secretion system protein TrbF
MQEVSLTNEPLTPYEKAKLLWDARMGVAKNQAQSWRLIAFLSLILLGISMAGNVYLGAQSKSIPYVVEVKSSGEASVLGTASDLIGQAQERAIKFFLSRFVMLSREIPADAVLLRENMNKLFQLVSVQGKTLLTDKFSEKSPSQEFMEKNRALKIASVLAVSNGVYQVDWFEAEYDKKGQKIAEYPMRGTFKIALLEPKSEAQIKENPLGIFIDYFSWTKLG